MIVTVAVGNRTPVQDHTVVQKIRIALGRAFQLLEEVGETFDQVLVDLGDLLDLVRIVLMMRHLMVTVADIDFRIRPVAARICDHQRGDAG